MPGQQNTDAAIMEESENAPKVDTWAIAWKWAPWVILSITAILYFKAFSNGFTNFDDDFYILKNPYLKDFSLKGVQAIFTSFYAGNYHPLTTLSYLIEYKFYGEQPMVYHVVNVLLHLLNTFIAYKLAFKLSGRNVTAIVVALLFGIHPMHVESVAWVSERKDVLYGAFYLLAALVYTQAIETKLDMKAYAAVMALFIASLLSKPAAVTLPVLLLAIDWYKGRIIDKKAIVEKVPFFILAIVFGIINIMAQREGGAITELTFGFINRVFLIASAPVFYIVRAIAPFHLSALHSYPDVHDGFLPFIYYLPLPFLLVVGLCIWKWGGASKKEMVFGFTFFFITVSVMLQVISVGVALTSERYTYIPYIGLFFIVGQLIAVTINGKQGRIAGGLLLLFTCLFCLQTWVRIDVWKDSDSILTDVIENNADIADCSYYYWLRGNVRTNAGNLAGGIQDFTNAINQRPDYAEAYGNRAAAYSQRGDVKAAIFDFSKAITLNPADPRPFYNRAAMKATSGDLTGAFEDYSAFLVRVPRNSRAYVDRGMVRFTLKDSVGACEDWKKAAGLGDETAMPMLQQYCK